ncbi:MAG: D-alanine--D-alanine ligase [Flavobacteriaceae bacterium]
MKKIIGVASGGYTSERAISKKSGQVVFEAIKAEAIDCFQIDIGLDHWEVIDEEGTTYPLHKNDFSFEKEGKQLQFDCVVNMIHGAPGENGELAQYLEERNIAHTSCDAKMAEITYDKRACLVLANEHGFPSAKRIHLNKEDAFNPARIEAEVGYPCFVKANRAGSSFGVYKVNTPQELPAALEGAFQEDEQLLIEAALEGREITVGVLEWKGEVKVLPITEIISENDFFDYEAKYEGKSQEITPAKLPLEWEEKAIKMAKKLYTTLGLTGITRSEFIFENGVPHLLEINTIPGMTLQSIIPQQAEAAGISLTQLIMGVIETSLAKKA